MARGPLAGAAGPGKFSKRTDGMSFQSEAYGEGLENTAIKSGAPMASTPGVRPESLSAMGMAPSQMERVTPLFADSQRPDEPITAGIAMSEGPGPEVLGLSQIRAKTSDTLAKLLPFDDTGEIAILYQEALARGN
jgi:hypothetical protein